MAEDVRSVHIIVFSFNRAMQCDTVLRSIVQWVRGASLHVSVVWHATGTHLDGYARLASIYRPEGIEFWERRGRASFLTDILPRLRVPRNLYHWIKYPQIRRMDNFQRLVESVIEQVRCDLVSFNTDDNVYYCDAVLPDAAFDRILADPLGVSYRMYVGANQYDCPDLEYQNGLMTWDYYDPRMHRHWAYPFSVDGTFYERKALLWFVRNLLFHNPVTLESFGVGLVRQMRLFRRGLSPRQSSMVALPLNKVDYFVARNRRGGLSVDYLNDLFLRGYQLEYDLPHCVRVSGLVPSRVWACRGSDRIEIQVATGE